MDSSQAGLVLINKEAFLHAVRELCWLLALHLSSLFGLTLLIISLLCFNVSFITDSCFSKRFCWCDFHLLLCWNHLLSSRTCSRQEQLNLIECNNHLVKLIYVWKASLIRFTNTSIRLTTWECLPLRASTFIYSTLSLSLSLSLSHSDPTQFSAAVNIKRNGLRADSIINDWYMRGLWH